VGHISIGDRVRVGAQAGVTNDVPPDTELLGSPAVPLAKERRNMVLHAQLPQMREQIRKLRGEVEQLRREIERVAARPPEGHGDVRHGDR
jgi:UDP-3-O-[3-hydroxymyristoyl] glucosamine N-acyltransferase